VGLAVSSDKKVPVLRGEIRFPKIDGRINGNVYVAQNVRVVIEVEPKVPPVKGPKGMETKFSDATLPSQQTVFSDATIPSQQTVQPHRSTNNTGAWRHIGEGVALLTVTILTDFIGGIGIPDDIVTIPAALTLIGTGFARFIFPVVTRRVALSGAYAGAGMVLKAAH
jgi:hypothetical protein